MQQRQRFAIVICLFALVALLPRTANSVGLGVSVTPGKFEASIPLGTTFNLPVTVANTNFNQSHIQATMADFGLTAGGDYRFEKVGTRPFSVMKWASIRPREFDLAPNTTQQIQLTLAIPADQHLSGEYAGVVFFQTRPERRAGSNVAFSARVAAKIYETIPGTVKLDGAITKMTTVKSGAGQLFRIVFKNTGNAHVYLRGQLIVQKGGAVVYQTALTDNLLVERDGQRTIEATGKTLAAGQYQAIATIDYGGKAETGGEINFDVR